MIRFPKGLYRVGSGGVHRSGWPFALSALGPLLTPNGLLCDEFIDRTFLYSNRDRPIWKEPWIGCMHHPPHMPPWFLPGSSLQALLTVPQFQASLPSLRGVIVLSEYLAEWVRETLDVPVTVVRHPTEVPAQRFSLAAYQAKPSLVQVGWYLRNQDAIHQVRVPAGIRKLQLVPASQSAARAARMIRESSPTRHRRTHGQAIPLRYLPNPQYDKLLASSVVIGEYFDVSASNTVIECIVRQTPILLNRHQALEEYLGAEYPLFYDDFEEAGSLLTLDRIEAAHQYLAARDRTWAQPETFRAGVGAFVRSVQAVAA